MSSAEELSINGRKFYIVGVWGFRLFGSQTVSAAIYAFFSSLHFVVVFFLHTSAYMGLDPALSGAEDIEKL